jgi:hypothetical protein
VEIVKRFTAEKAKLTISEDWRVGEALEIVEALEGPLEALLLVKATNPKKWQDDKPNRIKARDLLGGLQEKETWGSYLEKKGKSDKAKATAIGIFLRSFGPKSRHTETGTEYVLLDLARKLAKHVPPELPEPPVGETDQPVENFRTLLAQFEEKPTDTSTDTSFPGASDTSFPAAGHTHNADLDLQKGVKVSAAAVTSSSEKNYELTPIYDPAPPEVSANKAAGPDTLIAGESRNFRGVSSENLSNEEVGDNPDTLTPFSEGQRSVDGSSVAEASSGASEVSAATNELQGSLPISPEATKQDGRRNDPDDEPGRPAGTEGYL